VSTSSYAASKLQLPLLYIILVYVIDGLRDGPTIASVTRRLRVRDPKMLRPVETIYQDLFDGG